MCPVDGLLISRRQFYGKGSEPRLSTSIFPHNCAPLWQLAAFGRTKCRSGGAVGWNGGALSG